MRDPFYTYGSEGLCAWKIDKGRFTIQTRRPEFARKLHKRQEACELGTVGVNCYLRQVAVTGDWRKIRRLITRYLTSAGNRISGAVSRQGASQIAGSMKIAGEAKNAE